MDWVWQVALVWLALVVPLALLTGFYLRRLGLSEVRAGQRPGQLRMRRPVRSGLRHDQLAAGRRPSGLRGRRRARPPASGAGSGS